MPAEADFESRVNRYHFKIELKNMRHTTAIALFSICATLLPQVGTNPLFGAPSPHAGGSGQLLIRDRVLAKINDTPLTVCDLAKRLAAHLQSQYPGKEIDAATRCEFYSRFWPQILGDCVDRELILADAAERKLTATSSEVREEMEVLFGPDIARSLEGIGMTYDEVFESVKREITVQRVLLYRAHVPAQQQVGPKLVRQTYKEYIAAQQGANRWIFRTLSIEDTDAERRQSRAAELRAALVSCANWQEAEKTIKALSAGQSGVQISEIYAQKDADLSDAYRTALQGLSGQTWSAPATFTSKTGAESTRLFYLVEREDRPVPSLRESASKLREALIEQRASEIAQEYLVTLRNRYRFQLRKIEEGIPPDFLPFSVL